MTLASDAPARLTQGGGYREAQLQRDFDHPAERVWTALTDAAILPQWLAAGQIDLRPGGAVRLDFVDSGIVIDSSVAELQPGRVLEYSWSSPGEPVRPIRWQVEPTEGGCRLTLGVRVPEAEDAARAWAGWEAHLEMLAAALEGVPIKFPFEQFKAAREAYRQRLEA